MKIQITLKSPDSLGDSAREYAEQKFDPDDEESPTKQMLEDEFVEICSKWFNYSEYLTVEVDTDKKEIGVV